MLLCMFVCSAFAQWPGKQIATLSTDPATTLKDGYYVIYNNGRGTFMNSEGALGQVRVTWPTSATKSGVEALASDEVLTNAQGQMAKTGYVFYVNVEENNKLSLKSGYNDFVQVLTGNSGANFVATEGFWEYAVKEGGFVFLKNPTANKGLDCNGWSASEHSYSNAAGWDADGSQNTAGNQSWTFYEATLGDADLVDITYNYYDDSKKITSVTKNNVTVGTAYPEANDMPAYVSVTGVPRGVVSAAGELDLQCSLSESFPFKNNFGLTVNEGKRWLIGNDANTELTLTGLSIANLESADTYTWTLEGNWYEGFNFKHKGTNKYLASNAETPDEGTGTVLQETADGKAMFDIVLNAGKYYIKFHGSENSYIQQYGGVNSSKLSFWLSNDNIGDKGSMFAVQDVKPETLLNNFKTENAPIAGYVGGYDATAEEINNLTLQTVTEFVANTDVVELVAGYYFVKGTGGMGGPAGYVTPNKEWVLTHEGKDVMKGVEFTEGQKFNANHIWKFETCEDGFKLQQVNLGTYANLIDANAAGGTSTIKSDYNSGDKFMFTAEESGKFIIKNSGGHVMRTENNGIINYWGTENKETWYIIPATAIDITIGEAGYATTYLPFDVTLPNTVKAYAVTSIEGESAKLIEKTNIPANTGAILEGKGTHTLTIAEATPDWTGNKLEGTFVNTYVGNGAYVLAKPTIDEVAQPVGFYKATLNKNADGETGTTHFLNNANKAYLPASAVTGNARFISFDFGTETAIDELKGENGNVKTVIYDLAGRRVQGAQKGIFIVNGKKVVK